MKWNKKIKSIKKLSKLKNQKSISSSSSSPSSPNTSSKSSSPKLFFLKCNPVTSFPSSSIKYLFSWSHSIVPFYNFLLIVLLDLSLKDSIKSFDYFSISFIFSFFSFSVIFTYFGVSKSDYRHLGHTYFYSAQRSQTFI